ncbi:MAG: di-trans,poly-cis-decaprenylcistransferase [Phycisphaerae bacterium]|nr:di-trans,poly-cis-decaprenylcistransferase [Phycisphaerae bacterium]NIX31715.1 di-trans,poly-cis-decaprenylcistransferase [Phycisphaerae bacterium]
MTKLDTVIEATPIEVWPPLPCVPTHVGIIMDGNGRWAKARGLPRAAGHRQGAENLRRILEGAVEFGVKILTIYAFSTENWKRPKPEVRGLMSLFDYYFDRELDELNKHGVQLRHAGQMEGTSDRLRKKILRAVERTKHNNKLILNVAFNYGGRNEIINAVREIMRNGIDPEMIDEDMISQHLYTRGLPDPDLIIRTSGEFRTSNFLIWQGAYAEYYVTPTYWPDFGQAELYEALLTFSKRQRRYGGVVDAG